MIKATSVMMSTTSTVKISTKMTYNEHYEEAKMLSYRADIDSEGELEHGVQLVVCCPAPVENVLRKYVIMTSVTGSAANDLLHVQRDKVQRKERQRRRVGE